MKRTTEVLKRARALVDVGWAKGAYSVEDVDSGVVLYCPLGAIRRAAEDLTDLLVGRWRRT